MLQAGKYEIHILEIGSFYLDAGVVFGLIPAVLWKKKVKTDQKNRIKMALRSLLVVGENRKILIDTGAGEDLNPKIKKIYNLDYSEASLSKALAKIGIKFHDITDVVNTHLHFDHCGGNTIVTKNQISPTFPKAEYYVQKEQYEWAQSPSVLDRNSFFAENYQTLQKQGRLTLLNGETELFPGIDVFITQGHTPGQQHILIDDASEPVFFSADLFPLHHNIKTTWISSLELFPLDFVQEKENILSQAKEEHWRIIFSHDPIIKSAKVQNSDGKYYKIIEYN